MNQRHLRAGVAAAALALFGAACTTVASQSAKTATVHVALTDFAMEAAGSVAAGQPVELVADNHGKVIHSMAVEAAGKQYVTRILNPGEQATLSLPALEAGSYSVWCTVAGHREAGMHSTLSVGAAAGSAPQTLSPEQIDAAHEKGIKAFPAKTQGLGGQVLKPRLVGGVKVFDVEAAPVRWEVSPGEFVDAYAYNGQIPGPEIRVRKGDKVRVVLANKLPESTTIHFHGVTVPNAMDGVPYITQPPVKPGGRFTYEFTVTDAPGTHMYHSHHNAEEQIGKGLLGAFIVEPDRPDWDVEQTMVLGDGPLGYTLNGKGFPATAPIAAGLGKRVLVRFMNEGQALHPMHLHGFRFRVVARDGQPVAPYLVDTLTVAPGERYDAVFVANLAGIWAFHCHVLSHAESAHGMHGMVTAVIVK